MGKVIKINGEYFVEFYGNGLLFRKKAGFDKALAEKILADIEATTPEGVMDVVGLDVEFQIFVIKYLEFSEKEHNVKSFKRFKSALEHFSDFLLRELPDIRRLSQITPKVIEEYKAHLLKFQKNPESALKTHTINFTFYLLRDIFEHAVTLGWSNDNPTLHLEFLSESRKRPKTYSLKEVKDFLKGNSAYHDGLDVLTPEKLESIIESSRMDSAVNVQIVINTFAENLLNRDISLIKLYRYLKFSDVTKVMYYTPFVQPRKDLKF